MLPYLLVPLIVLMSCFIAYAGDRIGHRLGKKRLSLLRMRPRHTAIVFTVVAGMLIAMATLALVMLADRQVEQALLAFPEVEASVKQYRMDSVRWQSSARTWLARAGENRSALNVSQAHLLLAQKQEMAALQSLSAARSRLQGAIDRLTNLRAERDRLEGEMLSLHSKNQQLGQEFSEKTRQVAELGSRVRSAEADVARRKDALARLNTNLQSVSDKLLAAQATTQLVEAQNQTFEAQNSRLGNQNARLTGENLDLVAQNQSLKGSNDDLQQRNAGLQSDARALTQQISDLNQQYGRLKTQLAGMHAEAVDRIVSSRKNPIVYEQNQLITQRVIDCDRNIAHIREDVRDLVSEAEGAAHKAGAAPDETLAQSLVLANPEDLSIPHDQLVDQFVHWLDDQHGLVVVRIISLWRSFSGEPVIATIGAVPNRLVFPRGETIARLEIDGKDSERALREQVAVFLSKDVRPKAIDAGLLPDANGQISTDVLDKILEVSHEVHRKGRPVEVAAQVAQDTWTSQPLDLTFKVK